ncbi:MAG: hypothetical protein KKA67_01280 [Spirochaetes bacterium]|nr:hypothetical protein [Spirochaetota bacterium]MBU1079209.1 hypothetical protein [Spirochaetota bacterium]
MRKLLGAAMASLVGSCLLSASCAGRDASGVEAAVAARAAAISSGDKALYMSLLVPDDPEFTLEQSRWFDYRLSATISGFELRVESLEKLGEDEYVAAIRQSYRIGEPGEPGEPREVAYTERYRRVNGAWLDADLYLKAKESDHFVLKYQASVEDKSAAAILEQAESAWYSVRRAYGDAPAGKTTLKAFSDRELLRQNSKITIGRLFSGWAEPGESIKMWVRPDPKYAYKPTLAHELVHKLTLSVAPNQCSWLAEGLANYYGNFAAQDWDYLSSGYHKPSDYDRSVAWLAGIDSQLIADDAEWALYGGMAGTVVRFMAERYGKETPRAVVKALSAGASPVRGGYVYAIHDAAWREDLAAAILTVLGIGMDRFDADWRAWIEEL